MIAFCAAQGAAQVPVPNDVAPTREALTPVPGPAQPPAPRLSVIGDIERSPCPLADPKYASITVSIANVSFNNLKGATAEDMRPAWAPFVGGAQPVAVLCEIRDAAASILRQRGYLAAVQVPTQRIENGEVRMEMLYARITAVRARGETKGAERMIARYLGRLSQDEIFDRNRAERYLLLARDLPGYNVQLTLKPAGTGPGELIGEVTVLRRPYAVDVTVQNLSSRAVGRWGGQLRAQAFGLTGMGDATTVALYSTSDFEEQQIVQVAHEFRLGGQGLRIGGQFTHAWTEPDIGAAGAGSLLKARTLFASLEASYPLLRRQARTLTLAGGFDLVNQRVNFGASPLNRDRLRVLFARVSGEAVDVAHMAPRWRAAGTLELRRGLSILGATDCAIVCGGAVTPSRRDADAGAGLVRASGVVDIAIGKSLGLSVAPRAQISFDPVFAFEEFSAGNYTVGRGFDPGVISGDNGVGTNVELRGPGLPIRKLRDLTLRPYLFGDIAYVWNRNAGTQFALTERSLLSLGGGVRAALSDRLRLDASLAVPVERPTDAGGFRAPRSARVLLTLTSRILPWSDAR